MFTGKTRLVKTGLFVLLAALVLLVATTAFAAYGKTRNVVIPAEDRFAPYAMTIHVGDSVRWTNNDEDDHTLSSVDVFTTAGHRGTQMILAADGGTATLTFNKAGLFVYRCEFHSMLDAYNQPVAPGPDGGIQDASGNFGTPMTGVIAVVP